MTPRRLRLLAAALVGLCILPAARVSRAAGSSVQDGGAAASERRFVVSLTYEDYERLIEQPFAVPPGTRRIELQYEASGADARTVVDLGLRGPAGLRGWSGGGRSRVSVSALGATPGYLPGPLESGEWAVLLGVPNIRPGRTDTVTVTVRLYDRDLSESPALAGRGPGWYVGDLHAHSAHSDGHTRSSAGRRVGTPPHRVFDAALAAGLDFVALTDHNTASHWLDVERLQPYYDRLLLPRAREITTYRGHANAIGERAFRDFRLTSPDASPADVLAGPAADGAFVSINHPRLPDDEACMGCGWNLTTPDVLQHVHGIEVVNGEAASGPLSGWSFWAGLLNRGLRLTAVGGSDEHTVDDDADRRLGRPATVVWMRELSEAALVEGLRSGRAYVRVRGPAGPVLEGFGAARGTAEAGMGDLLPGEGQVRLHATIRGAVGQSLQWIADGRVVGEASVTGEPQSFDLPGTGLRWVTLVVRDAGGPTLLANAIYLAAR